MHGGQAVDVEGLLVRVAVEGRRADVRERREVRLGADEGGRRAAEERERLAVGQAEELREFGQRGGDGGEGAEV